MPKCVKTSDEWCRDMTRLKGLVVYLIRNDTKNFYKIVSYNQSAELPSYLERTGIFNNVKPFWYPLPQQFRRYLPAVYLANEYTFIYLLRSASDNDDYTIPTNTLSPKNGLIGINWKSPVRQRPYSNSENLVTIFWWKYDNKVYVIGEENKNWRIYELVADFKNIKFDFQLIVSLKTVLNFISIRLIDNKTFITE